MVEVDNIMCLNPLKEHQCIQAANQIKIEHAQEEFTTLQNKISSVLKDCILGGIEWRPDVTGMLGQATLYLLAQILFFVALPLLCLWRIYEHIECRIKYWMMIYRCRHTRMLTYNGDKTLIALWSSHGLDPATYQERISIKLLNQWLVILFDENTPMTVNIEGQINNKWHHNAQANMPFYLGDFNAPHYHFSNPFEVVLSNISKELGPYA